MKQLADFLDHGHLPFFGREEEIERVVGLWRGTTEADRLRSGLVVGEAGIGKSRMLEEVGREVERRGGVPLRIRLIPERLGTVTTLLAEALEFHPVARPLLGSQPEPTIVALLPALRRICRLRPTLLIIDDLHLLADEACREFGLLVEGLSEETLSIVASSRTGSLPCRGPLDGSLVAEIRLAGLSSEAVGQLIRATFGRPPVPTEQQTLAEVTGGNPLALRTALRSLIAEAGLGGASGEGSSGSGIVPPIDPSDIRRVARRRVSTVAESMLPPLDEKEQTGAARIAVLGEIFPIESALFLVEHDRRLVDALVARGVLVEADRQGRTLPGRNSEHLSLTFTHSLLHDYFRERQQVPAEELLRLVGEDYPLTSLLPLELLAAGTENLEEFDPPTDLLRSAVERINLIARHLNGSSDWGRAVEVWEIGWKLFERSGTSDDARDIELEATLHETRLWLMNGRLGLLTQDLDEELYRRHLDRLFTLTEDPTTTTMVAFRIDACRHHHQLTIDDYPGCLDVWEDVDNLLDDHPDLLLSESHLQFLAFAARTIARHGDTDRCRRLKRRLEPFLRSPETPEELRLRAHIHVALPLLHAYTTPEELEENMRLAESAEEELLYRNNNVAVGRTSFENAYGGLLFVSGRMHKAIEHAGRAERLCRDLGHAAGIFQNRLTLLAAEGALGLEADALLEEARRLQSELPIARHPRFTRMIGTYLGEITLLRGEIDRADEIFATFAVASPHPYLETEALLRVREEIDPEVLEVIPEGGRVGTEIRTLCAAGLGSEESLEDSARVASTWLAEPILSTSDLLRIVLLLTIAPHVEARTGTNILLKEELLPAVDRRLAWLAERSLFRPMLHLLDLAADHLPKKKRESRRAEANRIGRDWNDRRREKQKGDIVRISMIGTIGSAIGSEETSGIRGGRVRALLGMLVAAEMLETPLGREEFHRIASGERDDPNLARKTTNMAIVRLREALGADVVRSGEERHELMLDRVEVDLLKARDLFETAGDALRSRSLLRAAPALLEGLRIVGGEVPFPGLYDDFFEALRDDFEAGMRSVTLDVCRALIAEGDHARAEEILRVAYAAIPEDEELGSMLADLLRSLGKRAEAERVVGTIEDGL